MLRIKSEDYKSETKLVDTFCVETKKLIVEMARILGFSIPAKLCKKDFVEAMVATIVGTPELLLSKLSYYELILLKRLVEAGPNQYIEEPAPICSICLQSTNLVAFDNLGGKNNRVRYMICDEFREAIAPFLDHYLTSPVYARRYQLEQFIYGVVNLYGIITYTQLYNLIDKYENEFPLSIEDISDYMRNSTLINSLTISVDDGGIEANLISPFSLDPELLMMQIDQRPEVKSYKKFSLKEVLAAGTQPLPQLINPEAYELRTLLVQDLSQSTDDAECSLHQIWRYLQIGTNFKSLVDAMTKGKVESKKELKHCIQVFANFNNHCPRWYLKGHYPSEVSLLMSEFWSGIVQKESVYPDLFANKEVGRNDPCPCGSGKKYKKCCGGN